MPYITFRGKATTVVEEHKSVNSFYEVSRVTGDLFRLRDDDNHRNDHTTRYVVAGHSSKVHVLSANLCAFDVVGWMEYVATIKKNKKFSEFSIWKIVRTIE
jgi:uncharacterized DUF497 family protein